MSKIKYIVSYCFRAVKNTVFYLEHRNFILSFFKDYEYVKIKPFNLFKWHHDLFLFTGEDNQGEKVFIKLTKLKRILKNENQAYKKLIKNGFLKNHLIERRRYIKKGPYKALILKHSSGVALDENWLVNNINELGVLIKIVDEFKKLSLVHRDIKLDNFIYENDTIKIFDFSFMIDKTTRHRLKEIDLSNRKNMLKLIDLGENYKPSPFKWDDYYSLYVIFKNVLKNMGESLSLEQKKVLLQYQEECKKKINVNTYTILKF